MTTRPVRRYGERALLVEAALGESPHDLAAGIEALGLAGAQIVPAAATVLVVLGPGTDLGDAGRLVARAAARPAAVEQRGPVEIPAVYDGIDLDAVAGAVGCSVEEVVRRHQAPTYVVGFVGFAPGFAYLVGGDPVLRVPRHATPRTHVPAGSIALADRYTGIYPRPSPGGWQLIGRTDAVLFDPSADPPGPLTAGVPVRFVPARRR